MFLVVHLYIHAGMETAFQEHERQALRIFRKHGGQVISAFRPTPGDKPQPDEIHVLEIQSASHFEAFQNDPELLTLSELRTRAIRKTEVFVSDKIIDYP
jgi:uncharacterized protein (DUF1330 family)